MSDLYDADILEWSERQAALPRRVAAAERMDDNAADWPNIIEEIESVGRSQLSAMRSQLTQALVHMLKIEAWPHSQAIPGWRSEAMRFRLDAAEAFVASMRQHLDVASLCARALRILPEAIDGQQSVPVPAICAMTLDELLGNDTEH